MLEALSPAVNIFEFLYNLFELRSNVRSESILPEHHRSRTDTANTKSFADFCCVYFKIGVTPRDGTKIIYAAVWRYVSEFKRIFTLPLLYAEWTRARVICDNQRCKAVCDIDKNNRFHLRYPQREYTYRK